MGKHEFAKSSKAAIHENLDPRNNYKRYTVYIVTLPPSLPHLPNVLSQVAHFLWSLWSLIQAKNSKINFDYLE